MIKNSKGMNSQRNLSDAESRKAKGLDILLNNSLNETGKVMLYLMLLAIICIGLLCVACGKPSKETDRENHATMQTEAQVIPETSEEMSVVVAPFETENVPEETIVTTEQLAATSMVETMPTESEAITDGIVNQMVEDTLDRMTVSQKVYQLFIVTPEVLVGNGVSAVSSAGDLSRSSLQNKPVGGIIYFAQNLLDGNQTNAMISGMQTYAKESGAGIGLWIAVDEEGGTVARVASKLGTQSYSSMQYYGNLNDVNEVERVGSGIASDIAQFGFNLDFAPVADVNLNSGNELGSRIFSSDPQVVSDMVSAMVKGLQSSNKVSATLKHFPGLGAEDGNTHYDVTAYIDRSLDELRENEFVAFKGGIEAGADFVMVGHQIMSCTGDNRPSDLSYTVVTEWLREELGFNGVVVTDAHNMNTISGSYSAGTAALMAFEAGVDIVLMPTDLDSAYNSIYNAVQGNPEMLNRLDESVRRILVAKAKHGLL